MTTWMVTGAAGFVGAHLCRRLLLDGHDVVGIDNLNSYYDVSLKLDRLDQLIQRLPEAASHFRFHQIDLADYDALLGCARAARPTRIVHLAAQAGVRYGDQAPFEYLLSNLVGFGHVLELCRRGREEGWLEHLVYASSSSVYGNSTALPFSEHDPADHPVSLYAATKRSDELLAHSYSHLYGIPTTGLRFFTVYGPWGRPDMAYWNFTRAILMGEPISVYGDGLSVRDFTYVDDVIDAVVAVAHRVPWPNSAWSRSRPDAASAAASWRILNVGRGGRSTVDSMIRLLERHCGHDAIRCHVSAPAGDVDATCARVDDLHALTGLRPRVDLELGLRRFVDWYRAYTLDEMVLPVAEPEPALLDLMTPAPAEVR